MERCGISGDVRVVSGVPFRLTQNRDDTSWAEEYVVEAAYPLRNMGARPTEFEGPWRWVATLIGEGDMGGSWRILPLPVLHFDGEPDRRDTFNDALGELARQWKRRVRHPAGDDEPVDEMAFWGQPAR